MSGTARKNKKSFRISDLIIVVIFLLIAAFCVNLFRFDLLRTINLQNEEPVGIIVIKKNIVQRRHSDRVIWDRLSSDSPVYLGDLIRVADISSATLNIEDNGIDLDENTLVRITRAADGESIQISLSEGNVSVVSGSTGSAIIDINGKQVQTTPGTSISAVAGANGQVSLQVSRGSASFIGEGAGREITSGTAVTINAAGNEVRQRSVVVTYPSPNARFLKTSAEPFAVNFTWNRINLDPSQGLRFEAAHDRNFSRILHAVDNLDNRARIPLDAGQWFWRISFEDEILGTGSLTIADGADLKLESPAHNSQITFFEDLPVINFQWVDAQDAASYIIEISERADFASVNHRYNTTAAFLSEAGLEEGQWYWHVMPVFPAVYEGTAAYSKTSSFRIEKSDVPLEASSLVQFLASQAPPVVAAPPPVVVPPAASINMLSPANGAVISGLTALRSQTIFRWDADVEFTNSRFVLSSNPNPLQGRPAVTIQNPGRTVRVDRLGEGTWYWTVELQIGDITISALQPRRIVVQPIPLLPAPQNMTPAANTVFNYETLQSSRDIVFRWSAVQGANAYIFTLSQQTPSGRRQIVRTTQSAASYTLTNLSLLDRGSFVWQVEAVNTRGGAVEQRGRVGEGVIVLDFQLPLPVQIEDTGILYGN